MDRNYTPRNPDDPPDDDTKKALDFNAMVEGLANSLDGMPVQEAMEMVGSTPYRRDPKTGQLTRQPINWKDRATKAEKFFLGMLEERKKIQELILEACLKLEKYEFECKAGMLANCHEFLQIKSFATGVPMIQRPPLETMLLNGKRAVKRMRENPQEMKVELFLECGHIIEMPTIKSKGIHMNDVVDCDLCIDMLKEKQLYEA